MACIVRSIAAAFLSLLVHGTAIHAFAQTALQAGALKPEELGQLVAPIALYPDALLSQVLIASTYPLEVVAADRWASANKSLKGNDLKSAVDKQPWDDSVKSLAATSSVLAMMSNKLDWMQKLGDAVLAQQADVMDAIQSLRAKAKMQNKLTSNEKQAVTVRQQENRQTIAIESAQPDTVYVPYYDPAVVYGEWPYSDYPPYYFPAPGYPAGGLLATGIAFSAGIAVGAWAANGNFWGGGFNWGNSNINVNRPINISNPGNNWTHRPEHRHGVAYKSADVAQKFGKNNIRDGAQNRADFRGRNGDQVLKPGSDRSSARSRESGNRADAGNRTKAKPKAGSTARNRSPAARPPGASANRGGRDTAFADVRSGRSANAASARGRASMGGGHSRVAAGGGRSFHGAGGGGGRGGRGGGGGRGRR